MPRSSISHCEKIAKALEPIVSLSDESLAYHIYRQRKQYKKAQKMEKWDFQEMNGAYNG